MQTLTIECKNDRVAEHIYSLLSHIPKSEIAVSRSTDTLEERRATIQKIVSKVDNGEAKLTDFDKSIKAKKEKLKKLCSTK